MTELWQQLLNQWQLQTALELIATVLALSYTVLAIRHSLWCWPAALASTVLTLQIMLSANLYTDALLQLYYVGVKEIIMRKHVVQKNLPCVRKMAVGYLHHQCTPLQ